MIIVSQFMTTCASSASRSIVISGRVPGSSSVWVQCHDIVTGGAVISFVSLSTNSDALKCMHEGTLATRDQDQAVLTLQVSCKTVVNHVNVETPPIKMRGIDRW